MPRGFLQRLFDDLPREAIPISRDRVRNFLRRKSADVVLHVRTEVEKSIDWPCQIFRRYSDLNRGCRLGPANAISWLFSKEVEAVILKDDRVSVHDFLPFCAAMLERLRDDERIWRIAAANFQRGSGAEMEAIISVAIR